MTFLESHRRPLTEGERRVLRARIQSLRGHRDRARTRSMPIAVGVIGVLWLLTLLASDAPWLVVTAFWIVVGGGIALWVRRDMRAHAAQFDDIAAGLRSALAANAAAVFDVPAKAFVVFEEDEDEGACTASEIER